VLVEIFGETAHKIEKTGGKKTKQRGKSKKKQDE
jgi:hypothetical protein